MRIDILNNPMTGRFPLSLCAVVHDEMYFLPALLDHYRGLGVDRFVFLDDVSADGTREYLCDQPDCMVLTSDVRFFEKVGRKRAVYAWRQELLDRFCRDQWSFMADADEFVALPPGTTGGEFISELERVACRSVWGVMVDLYPRDIRALRAGRDRPFSLDDEWYFDARPHLWARPGWRKPLALYRGSRARLMAENGVEEPGKGRWHNFALRNGLGRLMKLNQQSKVPLLKWSERHVFEGQHRIAPPPTVDAILPLMHFKFTGDLGRKTAYALETRGYAGGSRQYDLMGRLLEQMEARGAGFLGSRSRRLTGPGDLYDAGVGKPLRNANRPAE